MPSTYTLISSNVLTGSAASVTFSAIPSTYTDLVLRISARTARAAVVDRIQVNVNSLTTAIYSMRGLLGDGSTASSNSDSAQTFANFVYTNGNTTTSNTFSTTELYLPNYAGSTNKVMSVVGATEDNATANYEYAGAHLIGTTSAISSITLTGLVSSFVSGSSFYLYGIKNS